MIPPRGFEQEKYPLRHRLVHGFGLGMGLDTTNTAFIPLVMSSLDMASDDPNTIVVNPHNINYVSDTGPLCRQMSIIDRMRISMKFTMTSWCGPSHLAAGTAGPNFDDGVYEGDDINSLNFFWRPIFNVYPEKLDAADEDTNTTVAAILALTKDATFEDVVPITTTKLPVGGPSDSVLPMSTVNDVQVFGDYNMSTNTGMEDHVFDEDLLQDALRRYTNKGALRSCLGRTRHVTLTRNRPYKNFYLDKFLPNAVRRIQPYGFFGIQVHLPEDTHTSQQYLSTDATNSNAHLGVKMITHYHEWNIGHNQDMIP